MYNESLEGIKHTLKIHLTMIVISMNISKVYYLKEEWYRD